jgi:dienelactone hydrolase
MNLTPALVAFSLLAAGWVDAVGAWADELVQVSPHRASTSSVSSDSTPPLLGFLARPNGPGRFPAVVLLHGCPGFGAHDIAVAATLKTWGYVALALDSLGHANMCGGGEGHGAAAEMLDAYASLRYLTTLSFVASARVAIMGWSMGGTAALAAVEKGAIAPVEQANICAIVAYYPDCGSSIGVLTAPALILVGERDDWTRAEPCRKLAAHEPDIGTSRDSSVGTPIDLVIYPDATHGFDYHIATFQYLGHLIRYDETASRDAEAKVQIFLGRVLRSESDPH